MSVCVCMSVYTQSEIQSQEASAPLAVYMESSHPPRVEHCPPCPCRTIAMGIQDVFLVPEQNPRWSRKKMPMF